MAKRLTPGKVQASRLGRSLPRPAPDPVLKCDGPAIRSPELRAKPGVHASCFTIGSKPQSRLAAPPPAQRNARLADLGRNIGRQLADLHFVGPCGFGTRRAEAAARPPLRGYPRDDRRRAARLFRKSPDILASVRVERRNARRLLPPSRPRLRDATTPTCATSSSAWLSTIVIWLSPNRP